MLSDVYTKWRLVIRTLPFVAVALAVRGAMWSAGLGLLYPATVLSPVVTA